VCFVQASGSNKAGPFERKLTALYTRATLEAGADLDGLTKAAGDGALSTEQLSSFLLCIVEEPGGGGGGSSGRGARIAVVAVEPSSGDVLYDCFVDSPMRTELEVSVLRR
jgi:DNA mismatch repair protein MSH3